jgi:hypothetical protein
MMSVSCPGCKTTLQMPAGQANTIVACPKCQTRIRLQPAAPPPAALTSAAPTAPGWYYVQDRKKWGPVSLAQLQELVLTGRLQPGDMVFQDGTPRWVPAGSVAELSASAPRPASPAPATPAAPPAGPAVDPTRAMTKLRVVREKLKGVAAVLREAHGRVLWAAGLVPVIGGMIGDFLRPIAPFNGILFLLALLGSVSLITLFVRRPASFGPVSGGLCVVLLLATLGFGAWWGLGLAFGKNNRGFMGTTVGPVASLQSSVLTVRGEEGVATEQDVEGDRLAEEVRKELEREKDADRLLHFAFKDYPANVIKAEVLGEPKRRKGTGDEIILEYDLKVGVDVEQYDSVVSKKLLPILEKVAEQKGDFLVRAVPEDGGNRIQDLPDAFDHDTGQRLQQAGKPWTFSTVEQFENELYQGKHDRKAEMLVVVNTSRSGKNDRTNWKWFVVPRTPVYNLDYRSATVRVDVSFRKKGGQELNRDHCQLSGLGIPGLALDYDGRNQDTMIVVSPYLISRGRYAASFTSSHMMRFTLEEIEQMGGIRCTVESVPNRQP